MKPVTIQLPEKTILDLDKHIEKLKKKNPKTSKQAIINIAILKEIKNKTINP